MTNSEMPTDGRKRSIDVQQLTERLRVLNPSLTSIRVEPPTKPGAHIRVVAATTKAELAEGGGKLRLSDPALDRLQIEVVLRFLDHQPGQRLQVRMKRDETLSPVIPAPYNRKYDA